MATASTAAPNTAKAEHVGSFSAGRQQARVARRQDQPGQRPGQQRGADEAGAAARVLRALPDDEHPGGDAGQHDQVRQPGQPAGRGRIARRRGRGTRGARGVRRRGGRSGDGRRGGWPGRLGSKGWRRGDGRRQAAGGGVGTAVARRHRQSQCSPAYSPCMCLPGFRSEVYRGQAGRLPPPPQVDLLAPVRQHVPRPCPGALVLRSIPCQVISARHPVPLSGPNGPDYGSRQCAGSRSSTSEVPPLIGSVAAKTAGGSSPPRN